MYIIGSKLSDEQLRIILTTIHEHHLDNIRDLDFDGRNYSDFTLLDVIFSLENLELLHQIIQEQILLKLWSIHLRSSEYF